MPGTEASRLMAQADMTRALENAAAVATLKEQAATVSRDMLHVWENITALRTIAGQSSLILAKQDDLAGEVKILHETLTKHKTENDIAIRKLERSADRWDGGLVVLVSIAGTTGSAATFLLQWAIAHFWPSSK